MFVIETEDNTDCLINFDNRIFIIDYIEFDKIKPLLNDKICDEIYKNKKVEFDKNNEIKCMVSCVNNKNNQLIGTAYLKSIYLKEIDPSYCEVEFKFDENHKIIINAFN